jgi:hypothetical protein
MLISNESAFHFLYFVSKCVKFESTFLVIMIGLAINMMLVNYSLSIETQKSPNTRWLKLVNKDKNLASF